MTDQLRLIPDQPPMPVYRVMPLDEIEPNEALLGDPPDRAFVENIGTYGVIEPIGLIQASHWPEDGCKLRVAYGRKRIKAMRELGRDAIPAFVYADETGRLEVLALIENEQRRRNIASDLDSIESLMRQGAALDDICLAVGMTKQRVQAIMRLARLTPLLRQALRAGQLRESAAIEAARLDSARQDRLAATDGPILVKAVRQARRAKAAEVERQLPEVLFQTPGAEPIPSSSRNELGPTLSLTREEVLTWVRDQKPPQSVISYLESLREQNELPDRQESAEAQDKASAEPLDSASEEHEIAPRTGAAAAGGAE